MMLTFNKYVNVPKNDWEFYTSNKSFPNDFVHLEVISKDGE
jgi:hypothetical protein